MTVKSLISKLQKIKNQKAEVLLASDSEGNSYDICSYVETNFAYNDEGTEISVLHEKLTKSLKEAGYDENDIIKDGKPCIVLFP